MESYNVFGIIMHNCNKSIWLYVDYYFEKLK